MIVLRFVFAGFTAVGFSLFQIFLADTQFLKQIGNSRSWIQTCSPMNARFPQIRIDKQCFQTQLSGGYGQIGSDKSFSDIRCRPGDQKHLGMFFIFRIGQQCCA